MAIPSAMKYVMVLVLECQLIIGKVGKEEGGLKLLNIVFIRNMMSEPNEQRFIAQYICSLLMDEISE